MIKSRVSAKPEYILFANLSCNLFFLFVFERANFISSIHVKYHVLSLLYTIIIIILLANL